jgi:MoxR-like ATPase
VIETQVHVAPAIRECLVDIAQNTRQDRRVLQGASTRSLVLAVPALQARALMNKRSYVTGEDIAALAHLIFAHRIEVAPGVESVESVLRDCMREPLERLARMAMQR